MSSLFDDRPDSATRDRPDPTRSHPSRFDSSRLDSSRLDSSGLDLPRGRPAVGEIPGSTTVVPLNEAAAVFSALAEEIEGRAVGWSPSAVELLKTKLRERYGHQLSGEHAIERLVDLACGPTAA